MLFEFDQLSRGFLASSLQLRVLAGGFDVFKSLKAPVIGGSR